MYHTFWSTAGARPTILTILGMVIEEVRPIFAPLTFFIRSVVSPFGAVENLWENAPTAEKMLITLFVAESNQTTTYRCVQTL